MRRLATVNETTVEKVVPGDHVLTPQGQLIRVRRFLPHETDRLAGYLETELGLLQVQRGMNVQIVPGGQKGPSSQQELPGPGNSTGGNFSTLPASGRGPGGISAQQPLRAAQSSPCPRCGNPGMRIEGNQVSCPQCGYHGSAQMSPIGMSPGIEHTLLQQAQPASRPPTRHQLWSSRQPSAIALRATAVLAYLDMQEP